MKLKTDISILGFSSIASLTSLLLADKGIKHNYYIEHFSGSYLSLPPIGNPLTNNKTIQLEKKFLLPYKNKIQYIYCFDFKWYSSANSECVLQMNGDYALPIYAIDNRIRYQTFRKLIRLNPSIKLVECDNQNDVLMHEKSLFNIIGGGGKYSNLFQDDKKMSMLPFKLKRELLLFNVKCNIFLLNKYKNVKMLFISEIGYVAIYPFLHVSNEVALNVVVNYIKGSQWDVFDEYTDPSMAFQKIASMLSMYDIELATDLNQCELLEKKAKYKTLIEPYFKEPVIKTQDNYMVGIGDTIVKNDPITGQGYNSGMDMSLHLISYIEKGEFGEDIEKIIEQLYHLNIAFTQNEYDYFFVYQEASRNSSIKNHIISAFEDISYYFPWINNKDSAYELIKRYSNE